MRKRKNVREAVEKFSIVKTLKAIADAQVVILTMDAHEGLVEQDLHLLGQCIEAGRALVIALNKWDGIESDERDWIRSELRRRLQFIDYADIHFISALHGSGVGKLYGSVHAAHDAATRSLSTPRLTRILEDAVASHPPPMVNGRRIKLRYAHAGGQSSRCSGSWQPDGRCRRVTSAIWKRSFAVSWRCMARPFVSNCDPAIILMQESATS